MSKVMIAKSGRNWDTITADNCRIPEYLPDWCNDCRTSAYCAKHRCKQMTLEDMMQRGGDSNE